MQRVLKGLEKYLIRKNSFKLEGANYDMIMLIPSDKYSPDAKYSLLLSAKHLNASSHKDVIKELLYGFKEELSPEEYTTLSRINVLHTEDPFVRNVKFMFGFRQEVTEINGMVIGGVEIDFAYLLRSLVLDKLKEEAALTIEVKNAIGTVDTIHAGIIRMEANFELVYYTGKGLKEIWKPNTEDEKAQALRKEQESFLLQNGYIARTKIDDIIRIV
jgi:hypothetical protein